MKPSLASPARTNRAPTSRTSAAAYAAYVPASSGFSAPTVPAKRAAVAGVPTTTSLARRAEDGVRDQGCRGGV